MLCEYYLYGLWTNHVTDALVNWIPNDKFNKLLLYFVHILILLLLLLFELRSNKSTQFVVSFMQVNPTNMELIKIRMEIHLGDKLRGSTTTGWTIAGHSIYFSVRQLLSQEDISNLYCGRLPLEATMLFRWIAIVVEMSKKRIFCCFFAYIRDSTWKMIYFD